MSEWSRRRRKKSSYPWSDIFEDFDEIEEMMDEMMRRAFESPSKGNKTYGPYVYGFSMSAGPDGKPVVREFGNVQSSRYGPKLREEREPLVDVMEGEKEVAILAELPGVDKKDINLEAEEDNLTVSVNAPERKYHKELMLPAKVDPKSAQASYKNGVLEIRLKKLEEKAPKGEKINIV
jgi:HSP20 family protein